MPAKRRSLRPSIASLSRSQLPSKPTLTWSRPSATRSSEHREQAARVGLVARREVAADRRLLVAEEGSEVERRRLARAVAEDEHRAAGRRGRARRPATRRPRTQARGRTGPRRPRRPRRRSGRRSRGPRFGPRRARHGRDVGAAERRQLHGDVPDAAGGAGDASTRAPKKRPVGAREVRRGRPGHREGGGADEVDALGQDREPARRHGGLLPPPVPLGEPGGSSPVDGPDPSAASWITSPATSCPGCQPSRRLRA